MAMNLIDKASELIAKSSHCVAFTGAGISIESGIPTFRGEGGLWTKYDPAILDIDSFKTNPEKSWPIIKKLFFDFFGKSIPNPAHKGLAELEEAGILKSVITQNIDNLHQKAGSVNVIEFHGSSERFLCMNCLKFYNTSDIELSEELPLCSTCFNVLKPDFIFFGEGIPSEAYKKSFEEAKKADIFIIIGTTGEVMPASLIPMEAKKNSLIIEINPESSTYTLNLTDIYIKGKAGEIIPLIAKKTKELLAVSSNVKSGFK
jgi:NAD-dependent deacetylase